MDVANLIAAHYSLPDEYSRQSATRQALLAGGLSCMAGGRE
jgi:hypothetical protein